MKLTEYLKITNTTQDDFAKKVGLSQACISNYLNNRRFPSKYAMNKIFTLTGGKVSPNDFFNLKELVASNE
jgi:transcriptional regulator with XRE-family HTH domain